MSDARAEVLQRIRGALGHGAAVPEVPRDYLGAGEPAPSGGDVVELFCERCADYRATVRRVSAAELPAAVAAACAERGVRRLVTPPGGPDRRSRASSSSPTTRRSARASSTASTAC